MNLMQNPGDPRLFIGIMSGTSLDGIDAALVEIRGFGAETRVELMDFVTVPYPKQVKDALFSLASNGATFSRDICLLNTLLGSLYTGAALALCDKAGVLPRDIFAIGCHGQTIWHEPNSIDFLGEKVRGTLQIGDVSELSETFGCPVVSDFRVRDMAAGGQGAPLVPYTDFLLFRETGANVGLQNIGGIGNITYIPKNCAIDDIIAFDTGPGNMLIDQTVNALFAAPVDLGGQIALSGTASRDFLEFIMKKD